MADSEPHILLTNDDGIDAPGIASLREELTAVGKVTVVAPADNQSGVGRTRNHAVTREDHPWGFALTGTPADCVAYGLRGLDAEFDLVVSGVNDGPNAGNYVVGRSGTVGAGIEAAFLDTDAVAVSAYHAEDFFPFPAEEYDFSRPARIGATVVERAIDDELFAEVDLLNVNAPVDVSNPHLRVTEPQADYDLRIDHEQADPDADPSDVPGDADPGDEVVRLRDKTWPGVVGFENPFPVTDEHRDRYPVGTDRRAMIDGEVSVSPLSVSRTVGWDATERLVTDLNVTGETESVEQPHGSAQGDS
jgi:5'-nucleotidase